MDELRKVLHALAGSSTDAPAQEPISNESYDKVVGRLRVHYLIEMTKGNDPYPELENDAMTAPEAARDEVRLALQQNLMLAFKMFNELSCDPKRSPEYENHLAHRKLLLKKWRPWMVPVVESLQPGPKLVSFM